MIDAIQIRPLVAGGGGKPTTLRTPVTLGRKNLCLLWWQACPQNCQAWLPTTTTTTTTATGNNIAKKPCRQHCRAVRLKSHLSALSRTLVTIDRTGHVRHDVARHHPHLVQWKGRKQFKQHQYGNNNNSSKNNNKATLCIGEKNDVWMKFSITALADPRRGDWRMAVPSVTNNRNNKSNKMKRRIWLESSSSSSGGSSSGSRKVDDDDDDEQIKMDENENKVGTEENSQSPNIQDTYQTRKTFKESVTAVKDTLFSNGSSEDSSPPTRLNQKRKRQEDWTVSSKLLPSRFTATDHHSMENYDEDGNEEEIVLPCQVIRRDDESDKKPPSPRKVTPDEKQRKLWDRKMVSTPQQRGRLLRDDAPPLTQQPKGTTVGREYHVAAATTAPLSPNNGSEDDASSSSSASPMLHLPSCLSAAASEMMSWHADDVSSPLPQQQPQITHTTRRRRCGDLTLADWQHIHQTAPIDSVLQTMSDLVLCMNNHRGGLAREQRDSDTNIGRRSSSSPLWLPDLLDPGAMVSLEQGMLTG